MLTSTGTEKMEDMPVTPDTLADRYSTGNYPIYKDFCSFFVSGVVGIRHFDRNKCHIPYRQNATISDEAFTVLTLENNWARWSDMAASGQWKDSDVPSKWTTSKDKRKLIKEQGDDSDGDGSKSETPQARRYRGWSAQGIARYNQLFIEIRAERERETYSDFETYCLNEFLQEAEEQGTGKNKRKKNEPPKPLPVALHELWAIDMNEDEQEEQVMIRVPPGLGGLDLGGNI